MSLGTKAPFCEKKAHVHNITYGISLLFLCTLIGIGTIVYAITAHPRLSILIVAISAGSAVIIYGIFRSFRKGTNDIRYPIEKAVEEHHLYLDKKEQKKLMASIRKGKVPERLTPCHPEHGIVRLDIILSEDCHFATLQLKDVKRHFPITSRYYFSDNDAKKVSALLDTYNKGL